MIFLFLIYLLKGLKKLDVTHNELKNLPKLGEMRRLELLFAQHNNIEELPDIEGCEQIQEMYFGNNYIKVKCHYSSKFFASIIFIFVTLGFYLTQKKYLYIILQYCVTDISFWFLWKSTSFENFGSKR